MVVIGCGAIGEIRARNGACDAPWLQASTDSCKDRRAGKGGTPDARQESRFYYQRTFAIWPDPEGSSDYRYSRDAVVLA